MAQSAIRAAFEVIREVSSVTMHVDPTAWYLVGIPADAALKHDARMIIFSNLTNADLFISGVGLDLYENVPLAARSSLVLDFSSNRTDIGQSLSMAKGTRFWVKPIAPDDPTTGSFYMSVIYGEQ